MDKEYKLKNKTIQVLEESMSVFLFNDGIRKSFVYYD